MNILLGTHNRHKAAEILDLLSGLPLKVKTLNDFPGVTPAVEDGATLEENALKKAKEYALKTALFTVADDTGLEVNALNGAPGVYSARFAGEQCSYLENNQKLLTLLSSKKGLERAASFRTVVACYDPSSGFEQTLEGKIEGVILEEMRGKNGFGYDPIFYLPRFKKTLAELSFEEKNKISHRALALFKLKEVLKKEIELCRAY